MAVITAIAPRGGDGRELKVTATAEEALRLAAAEGLTLVPSSRSQTGYKGVYLI